MVKHPGATTIPRCHVLFMLLLAGCNSTCEAFQRDADIIRTRHLVHYGKLIKEYFEKINRYPLQGRSRLPTYSLVALDEQQPSDQPNYPHDNVPFKEWIKDVENVLGRGIEERYDPQLGKAGKPNFYIYVVSGDVFNFAVHLYGEHKFAKNIGPNYYKLEISNAPTSANQAHVLDALLGDADFIASTNRQAAKEGFFREREQTFRHYTKGR